MSDAGQRIMSGGLALAGLMRQQRRDALDEQKTEDERQINIYASKLMQADDFQSGLKDIPEEYQANAFQKAMTNAQSMIQADTQYQQNMKAKSEQSFRDFQNKQRTVDAYLDRGDYQSAAPLLADIYNNHIKDGQTVEISWGDNKTQPSMRFSNKYTNSTVEKPMTEEDVKGAADFTRQLSMSQDDFNALRQRDSESWSLFNQKQRADMQTATDDKGNSIQVFQQVPRALDGSFDPDKLQWIQWVPGEGPSRLPNGLPEGYKLVSHQKETADLTRAQADAETAKSQQVIAGENAKVAPVIGGARQAEAQYNQDLYQVKRANINTPDLGTTVQTESGPYARTPGDSLVRVPDDMAPVKGKISVLDPDTGKPIQIGKATKDQMDNTLKHARDVLKKTTDSSGNRFYFPDPQDVGANAELYGDMLDRVIADPNTTKTQKHAASTIKWIYQSYGVMPIDMKEQRGESQRPSEFAQAFNLYQQLGSDPGKQEAFLRLLKDPNRGNPEIAKQIESVLKKRPQEDVQAPRKGEESLVSALGDIGTRASQKMRQAGEMTRKGLGQAESFVIGGLNAAGESNFTKKLQGMFQSLQ